MYLIDKEKLKERFLEEYPQAYYPMHFVKLIDGAPPVEERKRGKWIYNVNSESIAEEWDCSECGQWTFAKTNYCPYCGARMEDNNEL